MTTGTLTPTALASILYQSVVDDEFRADLSATPAVFGLHPEEITWPESVEAQEQAMLDIALAGVDAFQCSSTCSAGPWTLICDGSTK